MKYKNIKITKRNDNRYQARFLNNGTYKYVYGKTQKECYDKLKSNFEPNIKIKRSTKLNEWIEEWKSTYKVNKIKESTLYHLTLTLNKYIVNSIGKKDITKITILEIENLLNKLQGGRLKQIVFTYLKDIFTKAHKNKIVKENIMLNVDKPNHNKKISKAFTREEEKQFVNACQNSKYGDFYLILLYQGMRLGELLAIEQKDINFINNTININKAINEKGITTTPKTQSSIRTIPIFKNALRILNKYKNYKNKLFQISRSPLQKEFATILNNININDFTIHSLRHTFITRWTEKGAPSKLIQKWVGHSNNNITEKVYTKINNDFETEFISKFDTDSDTDF